MPDTRTPDQRRADKRRWMEEQRALHDGKWFTVLREWGDRIRTWNDPELLRQAFRTDGWTWNMYREPQESNERLEMLGDSVIELVVTERLMREHPTAKEGSIAELRTAIVRTENMAKLARRLGLGEMLLVGPGNDFIRRQQKTLADTLEALVGAAYVDGQHPFRTGYGPQNGGLGAAASVMIWTGILQGGLR